MKKTLLIIASAITIFSSQALAQNSKTTKNNKMEKVKEVNNYVHFHGAPSKGKILMVVSSPSTSKQTG